MSWNFSTEPEFEDKLAWMREFVAHEIEPMDLVFRKPGDPFDPRSPARRAMAPLKEVVKAKGLWACHLGPELGGQGYGQLHLGLMNEVLGRSRFAPTVFGTQAPDTGNAEILARFGTADQKARYLAPLLDGEIVSCFSMTEPQAGADPGEFSCKATLDGDHWVIDGEKWFASHADMAEFLIVMCITNPDVAVHMGSTMLIVPRTTPGLEIIRNTAVGPKDEIGSGVHGYLRFTQCRVPRENALGDVGEGFKVAQSRLGGGRIHHAMRTVGMLNKAMDMMCERAVSRVTKGERLADKQMVQERIADSYTQITQFRLHVLYAAWLMDQDKGYTHRVRREISAIKAAMPGVLKDVIYRALHLHGSLGMSNETPLMDMWQHVPEMGIVDGPTEVHKVSVARDILRHVQPATGPFPSYFVPDRRAEAQIKFAAYLEQEALPS
ncbi:MAG: acyl-CoA dehydrogenase [Novosphingobium sp. 28-62-57]|uniref:acyl-CoA dehydrogenase family protein n=1 Tax=unclassified Novosphingobium TaxID=2644732 RepID=UPI000BC6BD89|nr:MULTISPECIES: acyl-CoA dehydrogenase family protein [unclassified Novosphingobium]OYW51392.1 MAG: acyl-CoA dehydrogenase [Novosphingobium sp. 12-62-10]OYZ10472.1 MAG: acyl-CoA dehydrogenase [Novosphingobium sp. 28-62-57]OZA40647.1 MAG: acyl-CoA dehydrogenase [Novosphingobium sp. 17-62-9]HQS68132.1 acyl-CoA dehydrogenase family protein [Novosphingobium sp.]